MTVHLDADPAQELHPGDRISRRHWSVAVGAIAAHLPMEYIHEIANGGFDKFYAISSTSPLKRQGFKKEDYRRIYDIIVRTSKLNRRSSEDSLRKLADNG